MKSAQVLDASFAGGESGAGTRMLRHGIEHPHPTEESAQDADDWSKRPDSAGGTQRRRPPAGVPQVTGRTTLGASSNAGGGPRPGRRAYDPPTEPLAGTQDLSLRPADGFSSARHSYRAGSSRPQSGHHALRPRPSQLGQPSQTGSIELPGSGFGISDEQAGVFSSSIPSIPLMSDGFGSDATVPSSVEGGSSYAGSMVEGAEGVMRPVRSLEEAEKIKSWVNMELAKRKQVCRGGVAYVWCVYMVCMLCIHGE